MTLPAGRDVIPGYDLAEAGREDLEAVPGVLVLRFDTALRVTRGPAEGRRVTRALPAGLSGPPASVWRSVLAGETRRFELGGPDVDVLHLVIASPVRDGAAQIVGGVAVVFETSPGRAGQSVDPIAVGAAVPAGAADSLILSRHRADGCVLEVSPAAAALGVDPDRLIGADVFAFIHPDDRERVRALTLRVLRTAGTVTAEFRLRGIEGEGRWLETTFAPASVNADGRVGEVRCLTRDITARRRGALELERRLAQQSAVAELGERALAGLPVADLMHQACDAVARTLDVPIAAVLQFERGPGSAVISAAVGADLVGSRLRLGEERRRRAAEILERGPITFRDVAENPPGVYLESLVPYGVVSGAAVLIGRRERPIGLLGAFARDRRGFTDDDTNLLQAVAHVLATAIAARRAEDRARHDAMHDPLTGLPNRVLFSDRLGQALARRERDGSSLAVLLLDIDRFKLINDSLGHLAGDELIREVAPRLSGAARASDTVARLGGDEFAVLCEDLEDEREAQEMAERLGACFLRPFALGAEQQFASASIGLVVADAHVDADEILRDADAAMYRAKEAGRGRYEVFDAGMRARAVARLRVENDLRRALDRDELQLRFQPIHDLRTDAIAGCEALVRWDHPEHGLIGPDQFIGVAEESGLIVRLGSWVLRRACRQLARWRSHLDAAADLRMTVNLSACQVAQPEIVDVVGEAIRDAGLSPGDIGLEITERVLIEDAQSSSDTLLRLQRLGLRLVIDDFGTGYSSLSYLKRYPVEMLKIDRSFIDGIADDRSGDRAIVTAIVGMASALGVEVIPEGVETGAQLSCLRELGCAYAQGFLLDRPLTADAFAVRLGGG